MAANLMGRRHTTNQLLSCLVISTFLIVQFPQVVSLPLSSSSSSSPALPAPSVPKDYVRKTLEREVLKHTVHYLKMTLLSCLKLSGQSRPKRKAELHGVYQEMELNLDLDILRHTKLYLMDRVVECRSRPEFAKLRKFQGIPPGDMMAIPSGGSPLLASGFSSTRPPVAGPEEPPTTTGDNSGTTSLPETTTLSEPIPSLVLDVVGRNLTCQEVELLQQGKQLLCRDLKVDNQWRLPNRDFCPPQYNRDLWRDVDVINTRTYEVLDVKDLCAELAFSLNSWVKVTRARVVWSCDETYSSTVTHPKRLMWLDGDWAGFVNDNGFLHDLECNFNSPVNLNLEPASPP